MDLSITTQTFQTINKGYNRVFKPGKLSIGLVAPIENYANGPVPELQQHIERIQLAEQLGFAAVWLRDVPFNVPSFGDAGQLFDPFVYLGMLSAMTNEIALGASSIVLPLRHPAHVAKAAASADALSNGRLILGVASGDRPDEYPALNQCFETRSADFRASYDYIRSMSRSSPALSNHYGNLAGDIDMLPKPTAGKLPLLITGASQQSSGWIAQHGDGWMLYPRENQLQAQIINKWRAEVAAAGRPAQPVMQPLYIDLVEDPQATPQPIHLGYRLGVGQLHAHLKNLQSIGVNHVALNLRFNNADIKTTLHCLADEILPDFSHYSGTI
ncbi:LLM class oxidoreductase [Aliamphritea ceti]|uniref:LLM class oxidoreductase n=1 Tax=Aliamphritea ceti TaxID=1524258 RepID=UPI0021C3C20B|nr:LLM class oxidoreductase [Aliamphritea ceti]